MLLNLDAPLHHTSMEETDGDEMDKEGQGWNW